MRVLLILCALARITNASPFVKLPSKWNPDPARSSSLLAQMARLGHFGEDQALFEAEVYAPSTGNITLYVTHVLAQVTADRDRAARAEVDQFHRASQRALLAGSGITEDGWQERVDEGHQQIEAALTWRDRDNHTIDVSRLVIAGTVDQLIAVTGECVARDDVDVAMIKACTTALASLDPVVDQRVSLALAPTGSEPAGKPSGRSGVQPTMQDGSRAKLPPMTIPQQPAPPDRRPVYVGGGILAMAAIFWWNRRRRERFEREDPKESDER